MISCNPVGEEAADILVPGHPEIRVRDGGERGGAQVQLEGIEGPICVQQIRDTVFVTQYRSQEAASEAKKDLEASPIYRHFTRVLWIGLKNAPFS